MIEPNLDKNAPQPGLSSPPPSHRSSEFEFSERDNAIIRSLAKRMNFVGLFAIAVGCFAIVLGAILNHAGSILSGSLYALIGLWTQRASASFKNVADTEGHDIANLMQALKDLRQLYGVQFWLCALGLLASMITTIFLVSHRVA